MVINTGINEYVIKELGKLLRIYGHYGLKILISSSSKSSSPLEYIRDFLLSNTAFTVEVYLVERSELEKMLSSREVDIVAKFTDDSSTGHDLA